MLYAILCILSFALQNSCCKEYGKRYPGTIYTQSLMTFLALIVVALIMAALGGAQALTPQGYLIAFAFGVFFVLTLTSMTMAMNSGHMGVTLLIQNSSLLVPTLFGVLVWKEALTPVKIIGIALILMLLVLSTGDSRTAAGSVKNWNRRRWLLLTGLAFFGDGVLGVLQGLMSRASAETSSICFTFWTSIFSMLVAGIVMLFLRMRGHAAFSVPGGRSLLPFAGLITGIGLGTAGGNCFSILAAGALSSVVFFPLRQGGLVLLMWVIGVVVYRERITRRGALMLGVGLLGLILVNMG